MSFAKYAQFYRDNGFFAGSKIKATVTNNAFIGKELVLSKGKTVLQTRRIPVTGVAEFFTDASGTLTLSADDGSTIISGTVEVSAYGTYNVTVTSASPTDKTRYIYTDKQSIAFGYGDTSEVANISYSGDVSSITATTTDNTVATATVNGNKVTVKKTSGDTEGSCTIKATVAQTTDYDAKSINISVTRVGSIGDWATASDETIVNMVARADAGEINLRDYWNVGDTRKVTLSAIAKDSGSVILAQPEQEIELVLRLDTLSDANYELESPVPSNRTKPSFLVETKDCLENLSPFDFIEGEKNVTVTQDGDYTATLSYKTLNSHTWLNNNFFNALPSVLKSIFKTVKIPYLKTDMGTIAKGNKGAIYNIPGTISQKIALPSVYESIAGIQVGDIPKLERQSSKDEKQFKLRAASAYYTYSDSMLYVNGGWYSATSQDSDLVPTSSYNLGYEGTGFKKSVKTKKRGTNENVPYYTRTDIDLMAVNRYYSAEYYNRTPIVRGMGIVNASGILDNFDKDNYTSTYYGISPIMFI